MKTIKRLLIVALSASLMFTFISFAGEGMSAVTARSSDNMWVYRYSKMDGTVAVNEWKQVVDNWYYFDENGESKCNSWAEIGDKWYYFDNQSIMLHDTTTPDGYTVGSDGAWITE